MVRKLPLSTDLETKAVLKQTVTAHRFLAELKGIVSTIPNEQILINTLTLQEAQNSSEIENIITTNDELFKAELHLQINLSTATKEVINYANALKDGFEMVRKHKIISVNHIIKIQQILEQTDAGFRKLPGTALKNAKTDEIIYTPPQHPEEILTLMHNLVDFINNDELSDIDPIIKMAIVHHQFESIHPFYDGNGRTGRIINILYLVCKDLLQLPVLYLSRYIVNNKTDYYRLLQHVRDTGDWEEWLLYMIKGVEETSKNTVTIVKSINTQMLVYKQNIRTNLPKIYSQDLINTLFKHTYTKIEFLMADLSISRPTASAYLKILVKNNYLEQHKIGRSNYYLNRPLYQLFSNVNVV